MVSKTSKSVPLIFLITDGTVEDERDISNMIKSCHVDGATSSPRIFTFGMGRLFHLLDNIVSIFMANFIY